jgi:hypothetical protein
MTLDDTAEPPEPPQTRRKGPGWFRLSCCYSLRSRLGNHWNHRNQYLIAQTH